MFLEQIIKKILNDFNYKIEIRNDLLYAFVLKDDIYKVLLELKSNALEVLIDCFAVKNIDDDNILDIYYHLLSYQYNQSICVYTSVEDKSMQSVIKIFTNANWYEREIYEMYNINFIGHNDLKNLFTSTD